jgi:hypothetical protein
LASRTKGRISPITVQIPISSTRPAARNTRSAHQAKYGEDPVHIDTSGKVMPPAEADPATAPKAVEPAPKTPEVPKTPGLPEEIPEIPEIPEIRLQ